MIGHPRILKADARREIGPILFLAAIVTLTGISTYLICGMIRFPGGHPFVSTIWVLGFATLFSNVAYMLVSAVASRLLVERSLPEANDLPLPPTAILYVVRNEEPEPLFERMRASFAGNHADRIDLWLVSNSESPRFVAAEKRVLQRLGETFGVDRVRFFRAPENPLHRKHTAIARWLDAHLEYRYLVVCDADTQLPPETVTRLARKAEHPANIDVALFQAQIHALPGTTLFARWLGGGQEICQRIYASAHQKVFDRGISYGSGCLVRCRALREIDVPDWVLSHDIWDTALLERQGDRVAFVGDVVTYGAFPGNYIEFLKRNRRWVLGTLESLIVCGRSRLPLATRMMLLYPSYLYFSQPLLLAWILSGFFLGTTLGNEWLTTQRYAFLGAAYVDLEMGTHLVLTMAVVFGHRFVQCRSLRDAGALLTELVGSVILCLNGVVYTSLAVGEWLVIRVRGREWVPMKKRDERLGWRQAAAMLWPTTALGLFGLILGIRYSPDWVLVALPFLVSFTVGIPAAYWTGQIRER